MWAAPHRADHRGRRRPRHHRVHDPGCARARRQRADDAGSGADAQPGARLVGRHRGRRPEETEVAAGAQGRWAGHMRRSRGSPRKPSRRPRRSSTSGSGSYCSPWPSDPAQRTSVVEQLRPDARKAVPGAAKLLRVATVPTVIATQPSLGRDAAGAAASSVVLASLRAPIPCMHAFVFLTRAHGVIALR